MPNRAADILGRHGIALGLIAVALLVRLLLMPWLGGFTAAEAIGFGVYLLACVPIVALGEALRVAQQRLKADQEKLSTANLALENKVEAQSLLAAIVASSQDAIVSKTLDGVITSWNKGAERLFGYTAEEAIGGSIYMIVPPELREQEREILERLRRGERIEHLDIERMRKDGSRVHISVTISPVYDRHGHIIGASKTARDITLRKAWQDALQRSEEAQRLIVAIHDATRGLHDPAIVSREIVTRVGLHFDATRCLFAEVDADKNELTIARGYTKTVPTITGRYPLDAFGPGLVGELTAGRTTIITDTRTDPLTDSRAAQQTYAAMQIVSMIGAPLVRDGRLTAVLMVCDGVTRSWNSDDAGLLEQVAERTLFAVESARAAEALRESIAERRQAVEALQEADRRKDEFLATLAHELRNPLAPIASGLHILRSAEDHSDAAEAARGIMERQVSQMVRLVDDLLDVARITTGKVELRCEPLDVADVIADAIETSRPMLSSRGQSLSTNFPTVPVYVNADRTRLAQVFANLLNNSAKYSEPGQQIEITVSREGGDAVVHVRDAGIGIHPEMIPRVFEMFRQADRTGGRSRGGLGIGLSLVKRIVEMHRGTVTASSAGLGRGAEFTVCLPAFEAAVEAIRRPERPSAAAFTKRRVLVVDDNADAAESLAALLQISGHETRLAHDGAEALEQARSFHPDVVFLDIGMPTVDGHETARRIREQPWGKNMVLVALTGWGQVEDRRRSKEAGFNHHLVKPADPAVVTKLLSEIRIAS